MKRVRRSLTTLLLLNLMLADSALAQPVAITVDASKPGRTFEGIGAVSAGASSRLLINYPEPQRSEILDYLFKPNYGAALQHLKVEIGGDVNSTDGVEPSHMHNRNDENYTRGYEWWLMKEAKKRNPDIILDCLAWGAPAWIGDGKYYSQDMADYVVKFIKGAKKVHGLDIHYTGIANERYYDVEWIKLLRRTLDANGLKKVVIVAADQSDPDMIPFPTLPADSTIWGIAGVINEDPKLKAAVAAIGGHYPFRHGTNMSAAALGSGLPLWSSEDGPWSGDWLAVSDVNRLPLQASYNRNYILCKITKTEVWSPITSYYDNLPVPGSGLMRANTPWSGHYGVQSAIWVTAHTTQFAQPGWKYLDTACLLLPGGGSCVALVAPNGRDYSIIVETSGAKEPQRLRFKLAGGLSNRPLHVWRTNGRQQFEKLNDLVRKDTSTLEITVDPDSVYSLTTTIGQHKGGATSPSPAPFPSKYREDFASYPVGSTPKYWSDFGGVFEVVKRADGKGKALRQVLEQPGIQWCPNPFPQSFCGEVSWKDYAISADVLVEKSGYVSLFGRITRAGWSADPPHGYGLKVSESGDWELLATNTKLASGKAPFSADTWHRLKLSFLEDKITAMIDGAVVAEIKDDQFDHGNAGIGCGWNGAQFANVAIDSSANQIGGDFRHYIETFNANDEELYPAAIRNTNAWQFLRDNIPRFDCPDKSLEEIYYFRWWTYRKPIKQTPDGYIITEFLPEVPWAGKDNSISCAAGPHIYEGRRLRDPKYPDNSLRPIWPALRSRKRSACVCRRETRRLVASHQTCHRPAGQDRWRRILMGFHEQEFIETMIHATKRSVRV